MWASLSGNITRTCILYIYIECRIVLFVPPCKALIVSVVSTGVGKARASSHSHDTNICRIYLFVSLFNAFDRSIVISHLHRLLPTCETSRIPHPWRCSIASFAKPTLVLSWSIVLRRSFQFVPRSARASPHLPLPPLSTKVSPATCELATVGSRGATVRARGPPAWRVVWLQHPRSPPPIRTATSAPASPQVRVTRSRVKRRTRLKRAS